MLAESQQGELDRLDELIDQQKWVDAYKLLKELIDKADEVALLVEPELWGSFNYEPLLTRYGEIFPYYMAARRNQVLPELRKEFTELRPDLASFGDAVAAVRKTIARRQGLQWRGLATTGPELVSAWTEAWIELDRTAGQALALLHAIGAPAADELKRLYEDHAASRGQVLRSFHAIVQAQTKLADADHLNQLYAGYIRVLPPLMMAVQTSSDEYAELVQSMESLLKKSPRLADQVDTYRRSTTRLIRWRGRVAARYLQRVKAQYQLPSLTQAIANPPNIRLKGGRTVTVQADLVGRQSPQFLAGVWLDHLRGKGVAVDKKLFWVTEAKQVVRSHWHIRFGAELHSVPQDAWKSLVDGLRADLLVTPSRPPLTLEAARLIYTAEHGPYLEAGGAVSNVIVEGMGRRMWNMTAPWDKDPAVLALRTPAPLPAAQMLIRLQMEPLWLAHEQFVWAMPRDIP